MSESIHLVPLTPADLPRIYRRMEADFPPAELKKPAHLQRLFREGLSEGWLLLADGREVGYAILLRPAGVPYTLLDYLAMEERGAGYGSACLALLKERYPGGILAEVEALEEGLPPETARLRQRRIAFYQRSGFRPCPFPNDIFGVRYLVHLWTARPEEPGEARLAALALEECYRRQLPPAVFRANVRIEAPEG
ncbi:MAG: GNAT family N-acetyltransferase [Clostridiales bacterium]|nr:GNAT family N-acetyltransferase [Clostridiales bacterium]